MIYGALCWLCRRGLIRITPLQFSPFANLSMLDINALQQLKQLKTQIKDSKEVFNGTVAGSYGRFGFVALDNGEQLFLPPDEMNRVFPGDRVKVGVEASGKKQDNAILEELISSELKQFTGLYVEKGTAHFVQPDLPRFNRLVFLPPKDRGEAKAGDLIKCEVKRHPFNNGKAQARISRRIGRPGDEGVEERFILEKYQYRRDWPEAVQKQVAELSERRISDLAQTRQDFSETPFITIDGAMTQDMDDAIWAEPCDEGWTLCVAIADPSALIEQGSPIDREAAARAASVYLPGCGIPMLPRALSRELCSLQEGRQRLVLLCRMTIGQQGEIVSSEMLSASIRSHGKLNYNQVTALLQKDENEAELGEAVMSTLKHLKSVTDALNKNRSETAVLFEDKPDYYLELSPQKRVSGISRVERSLAHQIVEEAMVAANRCAAAFVETAEVDGVFVVHPGFRQDRLSQVSELVAKLLPDLAEQSFDDPDAFKNVLKAIEGSDSELPMRALFSRLLERSTLERRSGPHSGMGLDRYSTFTSPIRKYNDLLVHRQIKAVLNGEAVTQLSEDLLVDMQSKHQSARSASNELDHWYKCLFMESLPDVAEQTFAATIYMVHSGGINVRLDDWGIEGVIDLRKRKQKYSFDALMQLQESSKERYQLGENLTVRLQRCELDECKLFFEPVDESLTESGIESVTESVDETGTASATAKSSTDKAEGKVEVESPAVSAAPK